MSGIKGKSGIYDHYKRRGVPTWSKGKKFTEEHKKKIGSANSIALKGHKLNDNQLEALRLGRVNSKGKKRPNNSGENHYAWKGGISKNPYPIEFNVELKLKIRTRDNFTCCLCGKTEREELEELNRVLCVNHIDFDKNNCEENNLNTLCVRCNVKINREREYWEQYFQNHSEYVK